ncbi:MAG: hypothetical protein NC206_03225 [Bacteroides sp.]|nr:hypothetical protein [Roseburia sp.]MCM1346076.1 hypothetical protein [Bacteroides sp.]MCM1421335.1 hypothetical protein [Bacteroides sp.]
MMNRKLRLSGWMILLVAVPAVLALLVMCLWNMVVPDVFGLTALNYWQALCLMLLSHILFGSLGFLLFGGVLHGFSHHRHHSAHERWMNMTEEQRKAFFEGRFRHGGRWAFDKNDAVSKPEQ